MLPVYLTEEIIELEEMMEIHEIFDIRGNISSSKLKIFKLNNDKLYRTICDIDYRNWCKTPTEFLYCYVHNIIDKPICNNCGCTVNFYTFKVGYRKYCQKCSGRTETANTKRKKTCDEKYGNEYFLASVDGKTKIKEAVRHKFGVDFVFQSTDIKHKIENTIMSKYGVMNISQSNDIKALKAGKCGNPKKASDTQRLKRTSKIYDRDWIDEEYNHKTTIQIANEESIAHSTVSSALKEHGIQRDRWLNRSGIEQEIFEFCSSLGIRVIKNSREIIAPLELDIVMPDNKLAIEVNGIYWHSDNQDNQYNKERHVQKTNVCEQLGYKLLHIFENEWNDQKELWKSVIKAKIGIFNTKINARDCVIREIDSEIGNEFCDNNHLQKSVKRGVFYGAFFESNIVAVIQIGKPRFDKNVDYEILRFCTKLNTVVRGMFSKFVKNLPIKGTILSYANRRWSTGNVYETCEFKIVRVTKPSYYYVKNGIVENRMKYQRHKLDIIFGKQDITKTEQDIMFENGYRKLFDSGNIVYTFNK